MPVSLGHVGRNQDFPTNRSPQLSSERVILGWSLSPQQHSSQGTPPSGCSIMTRLKRALKPDILKEGKQEDRKNGKGREREKEREKERERERERKERSRRYIK